MPTNEDKPITLILKCPGSGRKVIAHLSEDDLDRFIAACEEEQKAGLREIVKESKKPYPKARILSEEERYFYE